MNTSQRIAQVTAAFAAFFVTPEEHIQFRSWSRKTGYSFPRVYVVLTTEHQEMDRYCIKAEAPTLDEALECLAKDLTLRAEATRKALEGLGKEVAE